MIFFLKICVVHGLLNITKLIRSQEVGMASPPHNYALLEFVNKTFIFVIKFSGTMNPIFVATTLLALACSASATIVLSTTATTL